MSAGITTLLGIVMTSRFAESKKIMPAGLVSVNLKEVMYGDS